VNFTTAFGQLFQAAPFLTIAGLTGTIVAILSGVKLTLDATRSYVELQKSRLDLEKSQIETARLKAAHQGGPVVLLTDGDVRLVLPAPIRGLSRRLAVWGLALGLVVAIGTTWILATQSAQRLFEAEKLDMQLEHLGTEFRLQGELAHSEVTSCPCPPSPTSKP
jgi:hypothetical protein